MDKLKKLYEAVDLLESLKLPEVHKAQKVRKMQKKYVMNESIQKKLDNLGDPLAMISRHDRTQKYEAENSGEKYEYGLSDW